MCLVSGATYIQILYFLFIMYHSHWKRFSAPFIEEHFWFSLPKEKPLVGDSDQEIVPRSSDSLVTQMVKNPPAVRETWVRSLGWEDPLEKGMSTHASILALENPHGLEEPGGLYSIRSQRVWYDWATKHFWFSILSVFYYPYIKYPDSFSLCFEIIASPHFWKLDSESYMQLNLTW